MFTSVFSDLGDKFHRYKLQTYLFAFPAGIVICILYMFGALSKFGLGKYVAMGLIVQLGLFTLLLYFWPHLLRFIEYVFYLSFATSFFILTQISINTFYLHGGLEPSELSDVLNSLSMWMIVFMLGAYLTTDNGFVRVLIYYIYIVMITMAAGNLWTLSSVGDLEFTFIFRWVNPLASISIATLLIQRMGVLQQSYASTDALTGLLNRRALYQVMSIEMERFVRYRKPFSVINFDVDHFKDINDAHGHLAGDEVLREIAQLVRNTIRQVDYAGRWGGEEFLIILPDTDLSAAGMLAERLCNVFRQSCYGKVSNVTASFGVTAYQAGQNLEEMLHFADNAMYQAKQNGRDQVVVNGVSLREAG